MGASGTRTVNLTWDPLGRLFETSGGTSGTTRFLYDGDALVAEYDGAGALQHRYVHGPRVDDPVAWYVGSGFTSANRRHLRGDIQGSIILVGDGAATSNLVRINTYDDWGRPATAIGANPGNLGRFGYTGQIWLPDLGMWHYKARIYSPMLGRFLQVGPVGYEDQANLYAYVGNEPVLGRDPAGKWGIVGKAFKLVIKGGDIAATVAGAVEDFKTVTSSSATAGERIKAGVSLVTEVVSPVSIRDVKAIAKAAKGTCCFVAGTLVDTEAGLRPIESIRVGERVWARDERTGETALKNVTNLIQRHERAIWVVTLTGSSGEIELFETTDDHPWWIAGRGWKRTEELRPGMAIVTRDGRGMLLTSVTETPRTASTYNLTVADFETYFVGKQRLLVHNCPTGSYTNTHGSGKTYDGKGDSSRADTSARRIERDHGDPLVSTETRSASSDRESFKQESESLDRNGGAGSSQNYNQIESPGKRMRREDGDIN